MQIYAIINIQRGGKDMQYKNASIIARGELQNNLQAEKLQIFNGRASCKFSLHTQAAFLTNTYKLQIHNLRKSCNPEL